MKKIITILAVLALAATALGAQARPNLRALMAYQSEDYNTYPVARVLEEMTGYKVAYESLPLDNAGDKLNLVMASGEPYDFINIAYASFKANYGEYARRGALTDLTPLLDKYGPLLKAGISATNWEAVKVNGKIYGIPTMNIPYTAWLIVVRQDWLDKVGMKAPETLDQFQTVLKAFKDKDPAGNGVQNVPFAVTSNDYRIFAASFGLANEWNESNGKLVNRLTDPRFPAVATQIQSLYRDGLIDKDLAINKTITVREKFTSGRAGAMIVHWADVPLILDTLAKNQPEAKTTYLKPLKGKDGSAGLVFTAGVEKVTVVPKVSKNAIETIKYLNAKLEKETFRAYTIGFEGKHFTLSDGRYSPLLPIFNDERNRANNFTTGLDERVYPTYWQARVRKDMRLFEAFQFINSFKEQFRNDWIVYSPFLPNSSKNIPSLSTLVEDSLTRIIVSDEPVAAAVSALVKKWRATGGDTYEKELNDWFVPFRAGLKNTQ